MSFLLAWHLISRITWCWTNFLAPPPTNQPSLWNLKVDMPGIFIPLHTLVLFIKFFHLFMYWLVEIYLGSFAYFSPPSTCWQSCSFHKCHLSRDVFPDFPYLHQSLLGSMALFMEVITACPGVVCVLICPTRFWAPSPGDKGYVFLTKTCTCISVPCFYEA